jgi:hypothetical protein
MLNLEPMPHATLKDHWRVVMQNIKGSYKVNVDKDYIRTFTDATLPTFIKMKISFASAEEPLYATGMTPMYPNIFIYVGKMKELADIAWRVSPTVYILILHRTDLDSMTCQSDMKDNESNDTRIKSKSQSKKVSRQSKLLSFLTFNWRLW